MYSMDLEDDNNSTGTKVSPPGNIAGVEQVSLCV
jgi:hypothetical protein